MKGPFPRFIPKTDEIRVQSVPDFVARHQGETFYVTEKLDGTSGTFYLQSGEFGVCSRNHELAPSTAPPYWATSNALGLEARLQDFGGEVAVQGEILGPKVQGNRYELPGLRFYLFSIYDLATRRYFPFEEFRDAAKTLGLSTVPVLDEQYKLPPHIGDLLALGPGKSVVGPCIREGVVVRARAEGRDPDTGRVSVKVLSTDYLLQYGD
jgi:RNA ligase (TIGR02306 family)